MHYTANKGGTARNHKDYFNNLNGVYASAHLFVDDNEAICIIPLDEVAYHANDTVKYNSDGSIYKPLYSQIGNANYGAIGVEMCLDKNGNITEKTFQNTVKAVKELIAKYPNVTRNKIWRHYDVTGKNCPAPWVAKPSELERFKDAVFEKANGGTTNVTNKKTYIQSARRVEVIRESGDQEYTDLDFKTMRGNYYPKGSKLLVKEVVKHGNITRLLLESGGYFTANEAYVKKLR